MRLFVVLFYRHLRMLHVHEKHDNCLQQLVDVSLSTETAIRTVPRDIENHVRYTIDASPDQHQDNLSVGGWGVYMVTFIPGVVRHRGIISEQHSMPLSEYAVGFGNVVYSDGLKYTDVGIFQAASLCTRNDPGMMSTMCVYLAVWMGIT